MAKNRGFEKISLAQFMRDTGLNEEPAIALYNSTLLPKRSTPASAGYDFYALEKLEVLPGEMVKVPTGIKAYMQINEWLAILVRSGHGFKYNVRLMNQVGVIDADYYNNATNEGHIFIALQNQGDRLWSVSPGEAFAQGIFLNYLCVDNDLPVYKNRIGGFGSTDRRDLFEHDK